MLADFFLKWGIGLCPFVPSDPPPQNYAKDLVNLNKECEDRKELAVKTDSHWLISLTY